MRNQLLFDINFRMKWCPSVLPIAGHAWLLPSAAAVPAMPLMTVVIGGGDKKLCRPRKKLEQKPRRWQFVAGGLKGSAAHREVGSSMQAV